jgi:hypothetical protein
LIEIIAILREQEAGAKTANVCRKRWISSVTFYKWKDKYGAPPGCFAEPISLKSSD